MSLIPKAFALDSILARHSAGQAYASPPSPPPSIMRRCHSSFSACPAQNHRPHVSHRTVAANSHGSSLRDTPWHNRSTSPLSSSSSSIAYPSPPFYARLPCAESNRLPSAETKGLPKGLDRRQGIELLPARFETCQVRCAPDTARCTSDFLTSCLPAETKPFCISFRIAEEPQCAGIVSDQGTAGRCKW